MNGLLIALVLSPGSAWGKAYFAPVSEMIAEADAIGVVDIQSEKALREEEQGSQCRDMVASVQVKQAIVGNLSGVSTINIPCFFPCAIVNVKPGMHLIFLKKRNGVLTNSNWGISLRPITKDGVKWFDDKKRQETVVSLEEVIKQIKATRNSNRTRSNHSVERPAAR